MNQSTRRAIALSFITIFLISAPILVLYTLGYRYNIKRGNIDTSGALSLISIPSGANVYLNGDLQKQKTPFRITQLNPGTYTLEVRLDGFTGWHRQLVINAGGHAVFSPIRLFSQSTMVPLSSPGHLDTLLWQDPASQWIITASTNLSTPFNVRHLTIRNDSLTPLPGPFVAAAPAQNDLSLAILHGSPLRISILFLSLTHPTPLRSYTVDEPYSSLMWTQENSLLAWHSNGVDIIDLNGTVKKSIPRDSLIHAAAMGKGFATIEAKNSEASLYFAPHESSSLVPQISNAFSLESELVSHSPQGIITVLDSFNNNLIIFEEGEDPITIAISSPARAFWHLRNRTLLLVNAHEINIMQWQPHSTPKFTLLTRVSEQITSTIMSPDLDAVFYTTPTHLAFIPLNPAVDQEPHELARSAELIIAGVDVFHMRLFIIKKNELFSFALE